MKKIYRWKFLRGVEGKIKSESGNCVWIVGKTKVHKGKMSLCVAGLHCSKHVYQAFSFVQGEILARVECSGRAIIDKDKEVYQKMKIVKAYRWQKKDSVALSIYTAKLCLDNFEKAYPDDQRPRKAIEAAQRWLEKPTHANEPAARSAESAAWLAAESARLAAWSARSVESARLAARSARLAAESAAWSAARSVESARLAARSAVVKKISMWMVRRVKNLDLLKK